MAALFVLAAASPTPEEPSNVEVFDAPAPPTFQPIEGEPTLFEEGQTKRDVEKRQVMMHMVVWRDINQRGRREGLHSQIQKCCE